MNKNTKDELQKTTSEFDKTDSEHKNRNSKKTIFVDTHKKGRYSVNLIIQSLLLFIIAVMGAGGDYVWMLFLAKPSKIIIEKYNFVSLVPFGYGLFFPMIFYLITMFLLLTTVLKTIRAEEKKNSKRVVILGVLNFVFLIFPTIIGAQLLNIGYDIIIALFIVYLFLSFYNNMSQK